MRLTVLLRSVLIACAFGAPLAAQGKKSDAEVKRLVAAHEHDFDYLLGDWSFDTESKEWGKGGGRWSAIRLETGAILDEYRVLGDSGQTWYVTHTFRSYNAMTDQWELVGTDFGTGLASIGRGRRSGNEFHIDMTFTNPSGPDRMMRIRYYDIAEDSFRWEGALSKDGGKTWIPRHLVIAAKRIGPARPVGQMTVK